MDPWAYPGSPATTSGLLVDGRFEPHSTDQLRPWVGGDRVAVAAIGSNACPGVVDAKLRAAEVEATVAFVPATLHGVAVGHSAHVSRNGYIPTAPYTADTVTRVCVSWFGDSQVRALDATEVNYVRRRIPAGSLVVKGSPAPSDVGIYASAWGVLGSGLTAPVEAGTQRAVFELLARSWPLYDEVAGSTPSAEILARLRADASLRAWWRDAFAESGWALESGLEHWPVVPT